MVDSADKRHKEWQMMLCCRTDLVASDRQGVNDMVKGHLCVVHAMLDA